MTPAFDKTALRRRLRETRRRLAARAPDAGFRAAAHLPPDLARLDPVAAYYAQGSEIDPAPLAERLFAAGRTLALPAALARDGGLQFRAWRPGETLAADAVGVPTPPQSSALLTPRLVIAPLLAFDRRGGRLGQGGGHYDRTIENLRASGPVFVLGLAYAGQEMDEIPMEPHDQRLDAILTDAGYIPARQD